MQTTLAPNVLHDRPRRGEDSEFGTEVGWKGDGYIAKKVSDNSIVLTIDTHASLSRFHRPHLSSFPVIRPVASTSADVLDHQRSHLMPYGQTSKHPGPLFHRISCASKFS